MTLHMAGRRWRRPSPRWCATSSLCSSLSTWALVRLGSDVVHVPQPRAAGLQIDCMSGCAGPAVRLSSSHVYAIRGMHQPSAWTVDICTVHGVLPMAPRLRAAILAMEIVALPPSVAFQLSWNGNHMLNVYPYAGALWGHRAVHQEVRGDLPGRPRRRGARHATGGKSRVRLALVPSLCVCLPSLSLAPVSQLTHLYASLQRDMQ